MTKISRFFSMFLAWTCAFGIGGMALTPVAPEPIPQQQAPIPLPQKPVPPPQPSDPELVDVQVPIPKEFRKYNKSGSQCVWCSLEALARYHKIEKLYDLTDKYKHATGPGEVNKVLTSRGIKFKQVTDKQAAYAFLKKYVQEKKLGCGFSVPGHVLNIVHWDEEKGIVKVFDNSGSQALKIQTWTMEKFKSRFGGWAFVLFPDDQTPDVADHDWVDDGQLYF